ncbi:isocitrate lyase/phosphoenolpyruvate mutase family protein [Streptomyces clavifer]|uniref:isocitrate lyase/phosphoenolpyruvate mutase family protein n=1 Tax=Streptomyces clavifer TaxID=68188 RepID=UPI0038218355
MQTGTTTHGPSSGPRPPTKSSTRSPATASESLTQVTRRSPGCSRRAQSASTSDGTRPAAELASRLAAARRSADRAGANLFLEARIDTFPLGLGAADTRMKETLARAHLSVEAGAASIVVPGVTDTAAIEVLARDIPVPLNVMAGPGTPRVAELGVLGAARAWRRPPTLLPTRRTEPLRHRRLRVSRALFSDHGQDYEALHSGPSRSGRLAGR